MNREQTEYYRKLLDEQLSRVNSTIGMMKQNKSAEQDKYSPTELSNYDNHPAEMASELYQVEMNTALLVHGENILQDIKDAIAKIDKGLYGYCEKCGEEIPPERLQAVPYARMCLRCKNETEAAPKNKFKGRANEELVLDAPFGRKYLNSRDDDEHEGMDQLNDLIKYGSSDGPQDMGGYHDYEEFYTNKIDNQGIVDNMDKMSNSAYRRQLPD
ncbi:MAG: TraR/DksA C4-type zinc finger protein [Acetivibrionales bacterium]|jgi:YteA family regulatory protein